MIQRRHKTPLLFIITILMLACVSPLGPASAPVPTFDVNAPLTAIVETAGAAQTQTAILAPPTDTPTLPPSATPTETPTSTPTFLFLVYTNTVPPTLVTPGSSGKSYECQVLSVDPPDNSQMAVSSIFTVKWTVVNIGKEDWDENDLDYRYSDGQRIFRQSAYDFPDTVAPGDTVELVAEMQAPNSPGTYTTTWTIARSNNWFCPMNLTIIVN